jgi:hypothetical protein
MEPFTTFSTGAKRESENSDLRYDLLPVEPLRRLARRYAHGADKYGVQNYVHGLPYPNTFNHIIEHLQAYNSGDFTDDHLAAAAWGIFTLMHFETEGQDVCTSITGSVWSTRADAEGSPEPSSQETCSATKPYLKTRTSSRKSSSRSIRR